MKRNELFELVWNLQKEYLEFDPKVEIRFTGLEYGHGIVTPDLLNGKQREVSELRALATELGRDIQATELRIISSDGTLIRTREVNWPTPDRKQKAVECSRVGAMFYFQRRYSGAVERLVSWPEVQHLLVTESEIYLGELSLPTTHSSTDVFDLTVLVDGLPIAPELFHWLPPAQGQIIEALLNMKGSVFRSGEGLTMRNGFQVLVEEPSRWAAVVREFISRHGRHQAEALLGRETLAHLLAENGTRFALIPGRNAVPGQMNVAFP